MSNRLLMHNAILFLYKFWCSVKRKNSDHKINPKRDLSSPWYFFEYVTACSRYIGKNVSHSVVTLEGVSVFARSTEGCLAFTTGSSPAGWRTKIQVSLLLCQTLGGRREKEIPYLDFPPVIYLISMTTDSHFSAQL